MIESIVFNSARDHGKKTERSARRPLLRLKHEFAYLQVYNRWSHDVNGDSIAAFQPKTNLPKNYDYSGESRDEQPKHQAQKNLFSR